MLENLIESSDLYPEALSPQTSPERLIVLAQLSQDLAQRVAKNPNAPPDLLRYLGTQGQVETRRSVTTNPNTPTDSLLQLGAEFPEELLNNPVFYFLLLETPNLAERLPISTLRSLLKYERVPLSFIERASTHFDEGVLLAITLNPQTPKSVLHKLVNNWHWKVRESARLHVNFLGATANCSRNDSFELILEATFLRKKYRDYLKQLAEINAIPNYLIESFPGKDNQLKKILSQPEALDTILRESANPKSQDGSFLQRLAVALNPQSTSKDLQELALDPDRCVAGAVARNLQTPVQTLEILAKNRDIWIRKNLASNPNLPSYLMEEMVIDGEPIVCQKLAQNPRTPTSILERLLHDRSEEVLEVAVPRFLTLHPDCLSTVLKHYSRISEPSFSRFVILMHPQVSSHLLVENCRSSAWLERYAIAQHSQIPLKILEWMAEDANYIVRAIARSRLRDRQQTHPSAP